MLPPFPALLPAQSLPDVGPMCFSLAWQAAGAAFRRLAGWGLQRLGFWGTWCGYLSRCACHEVAGPALCRACAAFVLGWHVVGCWW